MSTDWDVDRWLRQKLGAGSREPKRKTPKPKCQIPTQSAKSSEVEFGGICGITGFLWWNLMEPGKLAGRASPNWGRGPVCMNAAVPRSEDAVSDKLKVALRTGIGHRLKRNSGCLSSAFYIMKHSFCRLYTTLSPKFTPCPRLQLTSQAAGKDGRHFWGSTIGHSPCRQGAMGMLCPLFPVGVKNSSREYSFGEADRLAIGCLSGFSNGRLLEQATRNRHNIRPNGPVCKLCSSEGQTHPRSGQRQFSRKVSRPQLTISYRPSFTKLPSLR